MALNDARFDEMVRQLQQNSFDDVRQAYGDKGFERWRNPRYNGPMADADASARVTGSCGDAIEIFLKFNNNRVEKASYVTNGCASSALCGSFTAELSHHRSPEEIMQLTSTDILQTIGRFPQADRHCATIAILALQKALVHFLGRDRTSSADVDKPIFKIDEP